MSNVKPLVVKLNVLDEYQRLLNPAADTMGMKAGRVVLKTGESVGEHSTESREEILVILEGKAEVRCEGTSPMTADANSIVYIPSNTKHNVKNIGDGVLKYIFAVSPV